MRIAVIALGLVLSGIASAQNVNNVYDRDSHDQFKLKGLKVYSTVIGPIVRTSAQFVYDNPAKKMTEASVWFELPNAAALSGFGYFYRDEYVPGVLMDKNKAWYIYTAITSRNEDPGILDQWSPSSYHAQIFPLAQGYDLRVHLYSVGFLAQQGESVQLPKPTGTAEVPVQWLYRKAGSKVLVPIDSTFKLPAPNQPIVAVAQKFKDGKVYVAGTFHTKATEYPDPTFAVLRNPKTIRLTDDTFAFAGWLPKNKKIAVRAGSERYALVPEKIGKGPEAAQLWAQQRLAQDSMTRAQALKVSMKYHIPSGVTALLAVPKEEMKVYKKKEAEFERKQREEARRERSWEKARRQNWDNNGGGDPEIRVSFPNAEKVYAVLPDGQVLNLRESNGFWGTNFDIPASAKEGNYDVKVVAMNRDGTREERTIPFHVDRTAPDGKITLKIVVGRLVLEVRSEAGLAEVAAYDALGAKTVLSEVEPGLYRATFEDRPVSLKVVLKDKASNKRELACSWQPTR